MTRPLTIDDPVCAHCEGRGVAPVGGQVSGSGEVCPA